MTTQTRGYRVATIDHTSDDHTPIDLGGATRDRLSAMDLRNGYVLTLVAGSSYDRGATVRPVDTPTGGDRLTAYRVTVTATNGTVTTDETIYLTTDND